MDRLIHAALTGKPVAWFSPTNKFLADTWRELQSTLAPVILEKNEQEKRLVLMGSGVMELWSLDSPDSGRGRKYALVVVDEAAMIAALRSGRLRHAAMDVFNKEPLPAGHELTTLPNVTLSAHSAFRTPEASENLIRRALDIAKGLNAG